MTRPRASVALAVVLSAVLAHGAIAFDNKPGDFDYYVLVLGWAPSYCRTEGRLRNDAECDSGTPHAFVLHGLWPQFEKGWPENCRTGTRTWVPQSVIDNMRDIMPSKGLVIHEYRTHGTCSGLDPERYFAISRELYERVAVPERFRAPGAETSLSADEIEAAFLGANPWLKPDMISISCRGANLLDIRVCFGRDLFPRACGPNEDQKRLCSTSAIQVPPVQH
ncbi:ribonuclease T2 family protein [Methyloceanibacter sp.]|uniref:ribonuclease T2 family protein n=1 Tax=Methyloceanibacter sp. TaxID=1965321 RepID=UPI002D334DD5|nr:ribonuclease T [Methyloceanibacter sp.]HZP08344.1 ribonuclease T [Methyloceanibacter sp.]